MKYHCILLVFLFHINNVFALGQSQQQGYFSIFRNSTYVPYWSYSFLCNLSANIVSDEMSCAQECVKYRTCGVAVYYPQSQTCSLYVEDSSLGQISTISTQESFVLAMNIRQPQSPSLTTHSTWAVNGTTIVGNPSGSPGSSLRELYEPTSALYNKFDRVLTVSDNYNYRVIKFNTNNFAAGGTVIAGGNGYGCNLNQFMNIPGIAYDNSNRLYTTDSGCSRLLRFPVNSNSGSFGEVIATLSVPAGLCVDPSTDELYVVVLGWAAVVKYNKARTQYVTVAGGNGWGTGLNQLNSVNGVYVDYLYTKKIYVADSGNGRVLAFPANSTSSTNGVVVAGITATPGNASNQLNNPRNIVVDKYGTVYVADGDNCRIQRWLANSTSGDTVGGTSCGANINQMGEAEFVLFDEDYNLMVADRFKNRILFYNIQN